MSYFLDFREWWVCCSCRREINPEFCGIQCPDCGHEQCDNCEKDVGMNYEAGEDPFYNIEPEPVEESSPPPTRTSAAITQQTPIYASYMSDFEGVYYNQDDEDFLESSDARQQKSNHNIGDVQPTYVHPSIPAILQPGNSTGDKTIDSRSFFQSPTSRGRTEFSVPVDDDLFSSEDYVSPDYVYDYQPIPSGADNTEDEKKEPNLRFVDSTGSEGKQRILPSQGSLEPYAAHDGLLEMLRKRILSVLTIRSLFLKAHVLRKSWTLFRRKPVVGTYTRIEWKCQCGHDLYADFDTKKSKEQLEKYAAILQGTTSTSTSSGSQSSTNVVTPPVTAHLSSTNPSDAVDNTTSGSHSSLSLSSTLQTTTITNVCPNSIPSFLELCVNTGPHVKTLGEIGLASIFTDGQFFQAIAQKYHQIRGFRSKFWLLKPTTVSFVRFSLENRHRVGILQKPLSLPPKSEVDAKRWIYEPCPLEGDPPISSDLFLHYLRCHSSTTPFWMHRFPRKLKTSIITASGASPAFGWGIHIDEGPDYANLFKANFVVLLMSGLAAGLWKLFERDFQGAFGFATWIIAVLNSLLMAFMLKWRQE